MNSSPYKKILLILSIACSIVFGYFYYNLLNSNAVEKCNSDKLSFINPEVNCLNSDEIVSQIQSNETAVRDYIRDSKKLNKINRVSVFYRDLVSKKWFGINQLDTFSPGSLLKLSVAISYYKLMEIDSDFLNQQILYKSEKPSLNNLEYFNTSKPIVTGHKYSYSDLIKRMIIDSDNDVVPLLVDNLNKEFYEKVLLDLGVHIPLPQDGGIHADFFSASTYAGILRALYNASYLNIEQSEKILELMTQSSFTQGLVAGLDKMTPVAHKFGEGIAVDPSTNQIVKLELHDCGIIYKKDNPYILCVMTEGSKFEDLTKIISDISSIIWKN